MNERQEMLRGIASLLALAFVVVCCIGYFVNPEWRDLINWVWSNWHMGICVSWNADYSECLKWGGY